MLCVLTCVEKFLLVFGLWLFGGFIFYYRGLEKWLSSRDIWLGSKCGINEPWDVLRFASGSLNYVSGTIVAGSEVIGNKVYINIVKL